MVGELMRALAAQLEERRSVAADQLISITVGFGGAEEALKVQNGVSDSQLHT